MKSLLIMALGMALPLSLLIGCGGASTEISSNGTGRPLPDVPEKSVLAIGPLQAFVSTDSPKMSGVEVARLGVTDDKLTVAIDGVPGRLAADLRLGMVGTLRAIETPPPALLTGRTFSVDSVVVGPIAEVNSALGMFKVVGRNISIDANTIFDGFNSIASLQADDAVRVFGLPQNSETNILATRIERLQGVAAQQIEVFGQLTTAPAPGSLSLTGVQIDSRQSQFQQFSDAQFVTSGAAPTPLVAGSLVRVTGPRASIATTTNNTTFTATTVTVVQSIATPIVRVAIDSYLREFSASTTTIQVSGSLAFGALNVNNSPIILTSPAPPNTTVTPTARRILLTGTVSGAAINVQSVTAIGGLVSYILAGNVDSIETNTRIRLRGELIDVSQAEISGGNLSNLQVGRSVRVTAQTQQSSEDRSVLKALKLELL